MSSIHRFFAKPENIYRQKFKIFEQSTVDKIRKVLKLNVGSAIQIFDGSGALYTATITKLRKNFVGGDILSQKEQKVRDSFQNAIYLAQALCRTTKIDNIVRMNAEIGVAGFFFFESDHSIVKLADFRQNKINRWTKIAQEATRQSEQTIIPIVRNPITYDELDTIQIEQKILLHSRQTDISKNFQEVREEIDLNSSILIIVGPEGGFSKNEIAMAQKKGFFISHLNLPILRTETAGLVAASNLLLLDKKI